MRSSSLQSNWQELSTRTRVRWYWWAVQTCLVLFLRKILPIFCAIWDDSMAVKITNINDLPRVTRSGRVERMLGAFQTWRYDQIPELVFHSQIGNFGAFKLVMTLFMREKFIAVTTEDRVAEEVFKRDSSSTVSEFPQRSCEIIWVSR